MNCCFCLFDVSCVYFAVFGVVGKKASKYILREDAQEPLTFYRQVFARAVETEVDPVKGKFALDHWIFAKVINSCIYFSNPESTYVLVE